MAAPNAFANAKKIVTPKPSAAKQTTAEIEIVGIGRLAALKAVIDALTTFHKDLDTTIKTTSMADHFIATGIKHGKKPESFDAIDGKSSASCQLRARSSASALNASEDEMLVNAGIEVVENVQTTECLVINPEYLNDQKTLAKVRKALEGVKGLDVNDFIQYQEKVAKRVVGPNALDQVFKLPEEQIRILLPLISTSAIRAKFGGDAKEAFNVVAEIFKTAKNDAFEALKKAATAA